MKRKLLTLAILASTALALAFDLRRATDADMAPSILPGDWVLLGPGPARAGDVVLLGDPLEPDREILRRVLAVGPARVRYEGGVLRVNGEGARLREMGRPEGYIVLSESNMWLVRHGQRSLRGPPIAAELEAALWLMADDRDNAVDSRWWGGVAPGTIDGVVWLRFGSSDAWRQRFSWWAADGPWLPPSKRDAG